MSFSYRTYRFGHLNDICSWVSFELDQYLHRTASWFCGRLDLRAVLTSRRPFGGDNCWIQMTTRLENDLALLFSLYDDL